MRRPCFPNSGSHQHGPPLLGRVRTPPRSPTSTLLRSPPTPSSPSAAAPVVPRTSGLPRCAGLVLHRRTGASANRCNAGDISTPAPHKPALSRGETRVSQVPGPSSSCVPCSTTPPGATAPRPLSVRSLLPSGCLTPWAPWKADSFRGYMAHGPLVRVPTHRRIRYRVRRKARYRPGGLTLGRAGFAPAG